MLNLAFKTIRIWIYAVTVFTSSLFQKMESVKLFGNPNFIYSLSRCKELKAHDFIYFRVVLHYLRVLINSVIRFLLINGY